MLADDGDTWYPILFNYMSIIYIYIYILFNVYDVIVLLEHDSRIIMVLEFEDVIVWFDLYVYIVSVNIAMNVYYNMWAQVNVCP